MTLSAAQLELLRKVTLLGPVPLSELSGADKCRAWALYRRGLVHLIDDGTGSGKHMQWRSTKDGEKCVAEAAEGARS